MQENSTDNRVVRAADIPVPLILMGRGIKSETTHLPVSADHIAPTLTNFMRIRAPNACIATALNY